SRGGISPAGSPGRCPPSPPAPGSRALRGGAPRRTPSPPRPGEPEGAARGRGPHQLPLAGLQGDGHQDVLVLFHGSSSFSAGGPGGTAGARVFYRLRPLRGLFAAFRFAPAAAGCWHLLRCPSLPKGRGWFIVSRS